MTVRLITLWVAFALLLSFAHAQSSQGNKPPKAFVFKVLPVTTDLQRLAIGRHDAVAYVLYDGDSYNKEAFNPSDLQLPALRKRLSSLAHKNGTIYFHIRRTHSGHFHHHTSPGGVQWLTTSTDGTPTAADHITGLLAYALKGLGHELGFTNVIVQSSTQSVDAEAPSWASICEKLERDVASAATEEPVGNDTVRMYPVKTELSRLIYNNSDCVLRIVPPLNQVRPGDTKELSSRLSTYTKSLGIKNDSRLTIVTYSDGTVNSTVHQYLFDPATFTKGLGFADVAWMDVPQR